MARSEFLTWVSCLVLVMIAHSQLQDAGADTLPHLGVNWGTLASSSIDPNIVVNLLKDNGIKKVKIFDTDSSILNALSGSGIEVMVGIPNNQLDEIADSVENAQDWVKEDITKHGDVNIRYISVGNEPFLKAYNGSYEKMTVPAMKNVQKALENAGLADKMKVTTALNADIYQSASNKPSDGAFRGDILDVIKDLVRFITDTNSVFLVNIYPFISLYLNANFPEELAFFDANGGKSIDDKDASYNNVYDANLDTLVWSLKKIGYPKMKIMVGEVGWPTDGQKSANPKNAQRFYQGLLKKMASKKGTPQYPDEMDVYLFALFDENLKDIKPGKFERHWGIFNYDGKAKFPVDFSGQGQNKLPAEAKGVKYQERQWCVLSKDVKDMSLVPAAINEACAGADCSSLGLGCSCANLDMASNASYAFNQYYQTRDQDAEACDFGGLGDIVKDDPSTGTCEFHIEIEKNGVFRAPTHSMGNLLIGLALFFVTFM